MVTYSSKNRLCEEANENARALYKRVHPYFYHMFLSLSEVNKSDYIKRLCALYEHEVFRLNRSFIGTRFMEKGKYPELLLTRSLSHINENFDKAVAGFDFWGLNEDFIDLVASIHPRNDEPQMITLRLSQEPRAVILDKYSNWSPEIAEQIIGSCRYILTTEYVQDIKHLTRSIITNLNSLSPNSALTSFMAFDEFESLQLNELTYEA